MPNTERTPPKTTNLRDPSSSLQKQSLMDGFVTHSNKRQATESPNGNDPFNDLAQLIQQNQKILLAQSQVQAEQIKQQIAGMETKVDNLRADFTSNFNAVNERVDHIETDFAQTSSEISSIQQKLEKFEQEKVNCQMVINGVETSIVDARKNDLRLFAFELLGSFACSPSDETVDDVFAINAYNDNRRIVVVFKTVAAKAEAMKKKRESKDTRKIFFDHRMVPSISKLFHQARHFAKETGGRAFLYGGSVYYEKAPNQKRRIDSADDLKETPASQPE